MYIKYLDIQKWYAFFQRIDTIFFLQITSFFFYGHSFSQITKLASSGIFHRMYTSIHIQCIPFFKECTKFCKFNVQKNSKNV